MQRGLHHLFGPFAFGDVADIEVDVFFSCRLRCAEPEGAPPAVCQFGFNSALLLRCLRNEGEDRPGSAPLVATAIASNMSRAGVLA